MRANGEKIAVLTCYDASFAQLCDHAGVDALLIGDSLGMVLQGHDSTLPVTLADIAYHTASVARGSQRPLVIADMPFGSFQESPQRALRNAVTLMAAGAQMVKIEGGVDMAETTRFL
jgi:3-methyl-2-oxobutanoate hydroxymethyltransferase